MRIATEMEYFGRKFGWEKALELTAQAGFDAMDISLFDMTKGEESPFMGAEGVAYAASLRKKAESLGIRINQAHAPFRMEMKRWLEGDREDILRRLHQSIRVAAACGCSNIVIHPLHTMNYLNSDPAWVKAVNVEYYSLLAPVAKETGIKIAIENMWQRHRYTKHIVSSVCASPWEHAAYVDACNAVEPVFTACLDVGHSVLVGVEPALAIRVLGGRLSCLHIHDVDGKNDNHTCPGTLSVDFPAIVEALREVGYRGEFTLEAMCYFDQFPEEKWFGALCHMQQVCSKLLERE